MTQLLLLLQSILRHLSTPLSLRRGVGGEALFLIFFLSSCQKDLCYDHPHDGGPDDSHGRLHVVFDWSATQNPTASRMRLMAFAGGSNPVTYPFAGMDGGDVSLWPGSYWFVAYNADTETTTTTGTTYSDFTISGIDRDLTRYISNFRARAEFVTRAADTDTADDANLSFIWEPERVWLATAQAFSVQAATEQTLPMKIWAATYQYTFLIHNVANLDRVSSISATLDGLARSYSPAGHCPKDYTVAEIFAFHKAGDSSIRGTLRVFGHSPEEDSGSGSAADRQNTLTLYVTMDNGNQYAFEYDVTADMQHPSFSSINPETGEIVINIQIDDIPIPDQPDKPDEHSETGLFDVDVDDFVTEEWDIFPY